MSVGKASKSTEDEMATRMPSSSESSEMSDITKENLANPFDPKRLAVKLTGGEQFGSKKLLTIVPVGKPNPKEWVMAHPSDDYCMIAGIIEDADGGQPYIVTPEIAAAHPSEIKQVALRVAVNRQGTVFLWKYPVPDVDGRENFWNTSHREAVKEAKIGWVRMISNRNLGAYEVHTAPSIDTAPKWPEQSFQQLLEIAFKGRLIADADHILLRQLRGEA